MITSLHGHNNDHLIPVGEVVSSVQIALIENQVFKLTIQYDIPFNIFFPISFSVSVYPLIVKIHTMENT